ncbi:MAG: hypothetical protein J6Y62_06080 [Clostridia bacterium]|nr:hypothetical protein [Clostridia bacterium]
MTRRSLWFRGGGKPHRGYYRGIWCDSSWELAFLMWCLDKGIEIVRATDDFKYPFRNGFKYYRPDFVVEGTYVEIKGVMDGRSRRKIDNFPLPLKVIGKREIQPYLDYARSKYGEDYWRELEPPA